MEKEFNGNIKPIRFIGGEHDNNLKTPIGGKDKPWWSGIWLWLFCIMIVGLAGFGVFSIEIAGTIVILIGIWKGISIIFDGIVEELPRVMSDENLKEGLKIKTREPAIETYAPTDVVWRTMYDPENSSYKHE